LRAERRQIEAGARRDGFVEVVSGLEGGERLVSEGLNRVNPGQPVRIAGGPGGPGGGAPPPGRGGAAAPGQAVAR
jgi:membrane fusion protein (multidrug efflux system)